MTILNLEELKKWVENEYPVLKAGDVTPEVPVGGAMQLMGEVSVRSTHRTPAMEYSFEVDGTVTEGASLEDKDSISGNSVSGTVGPRGSDTYHVDGTITSWSAMRADSGEAVSEAAYEVTYQGERVGVWELLGDDEPHYPDESAEALGGGEHYGDKLTEQDADILVVDDPDAPALRDALDAASFGDVVFVDGDAEIYSPSKTERFHVPAGVTLASDRGVDGSSGALLHTDAAYSYGAHGLVAVHGEDARVTGLRVRGPHPDVKWREHSYDYEMSAITAREKGAPRLEVDNCELWGFAHLVASGKDGHVHHNHLHHANMKGLGYCTSTGSTEGTVFEYNHCEHWRHVVAASGGGGYTARFNLIDGPAISHVFDQHQPGGTYTEIHHNTCRVGDDVATGDPFVPFATFRGDNARKARVYNNWALNDLEPLDYPSKYFTDEFITHPKHGGTGWVDIKWWDNHLGATDPPEDVGCPR